MFVSFARETSGGLKVQADTIQFVQAWAHAHNVPVHSGDFAVSARCGGVMVWAWQGDEEAEKSPYLQGIALKDFAKASRLWNWMREEGQCSLWSSAGVHAIQFYELDVLQDVMSRCYVQSFERHTTDDFVHYTYVVNNVCIRWCGKIVK